MSARKKCPPWLPTWACFRPRVKHCDRVNLPDHAVHERDSVAKKEVIFARELQPTEVTPTTGRDEAGPHQGLEASAQATRARPIQLESLGYFSDGGSGGSAALQPDGEQQINETYQFMRSLLSDIKQRHRVVTTLDTAASMHTLLVLSHHGGVASTSATSVEGFLTGTSTGPHEGSPVPGQWVGPEHGSPERPEGCALAALAASPCRGFYSPAAHFPLPSDPCKALFLDGDSEIALGAGHGLYGVTALSAEARLSGKARVMPAADQSSADASPASPFSITPSTNPATATAFSLISNFGGQLAPSCAERIDNKYGIELASSSCSKCPGKNGAEGFVVQQSINPASHPGLATTDGAAPGLVEAGSLKVLAPSRALAAASVRPGGQDPRTVSAEGCVNAPAARHDADGSGDGGGAHATGPNAGGTCTAAISVNYKPGGRACRAATANLGDEADRGPLPGPGAVRPKKGLPTVMPSLVALLSDFSDLTCLVSPGTLGGVYLGDWRGMRVAVKVTRYGGACGPHDSALHDAVRASKLQHPNLLNVYDMRVAKADEASLLELDPPPQLRPGWAAGRRPVGRLHRFLAAHPELNVSELTCRGDASLTLYPGDIIALRRTQLTPGQRALLAMRPRLGDIIVAMVMEYCEMGNLLSMATSDQSPFRASRFWVARVAQRALLRTAREVAAGLAALHAAGVTHGALQPSNVLLSASEADRRGFIARVVDVRSLSLSRAASNPLASGPCMVLLAPEALSDEAAEASRAADVFAFGMQMYVMAAGEMPFQGQHLVPVLMAVASEGLRPEWPAEDHPLVEPLFRRCVAQLPEERPSFKQILLEICSLEQQLKREKRGGLAP